MRYNVLVDLMTKEISNIPNLLTDRRYVRVLWGRPVILYWHPGMKNVIRHPWKRGICGDSQSKAANVAGQHILLADHSGR